MTTTPDTELGFGRLTIFTVAVLVTLGFAALPGAAAGEDHDRAPEEGDGDPVAIDAITTIPDVSATDIATAGTQDSLDHVLDAGTFEELPPQAEDVGAHGVADDPAQDFPADGDAFAVITNGDGNTFYGGWGDDSLGGDTVRGDSDRDVTVFSWTFDAPGTAECVAVTYQFFTDEFPGTFYNDGFVVELGTSQWSTSSGTITNVENALAVESAQDSQDELDNSNAGDTGYFYGTPQKTVSAELGGEDTLFFSIFDQQDSIVATAAAIDSVHLGGTAGDTCLAAQAPGAVSNLAAEATEQGELTLSWDAPADTGNVDLAGYTVYAAESGDALSEVATVGADTTETTLDGLEDGTEYDIAVAADNGFFETQSDAVTQVTRPSAPQDLTAEAGTPDAGSPTAPNTVELDWDAPGDPADDALLEYHVYRDGEQVATVTADDTEYTDNVDGTDTPYTYTVTAENDGGEGLQSDEACSSGVYAADPLASLFVC